MTKRRKRVRVGLVLLGLALVYPAWLVFVGMMASRTTAVRVPLVDGQDISLPVHVGWAGLFTLKFAAKTTDGADLQGVESCLLDLPDPHSQPVPCEGITDRLHLSFRLEDTRGQVVTGSYGLAMAGKYQDRNREYGPFLGAQQMGNELLILERLERGEYRLLVTTVHVPAGLGKAAPEMLLERQASQFALLEAMPWLVLSGLLGAFGFGMLLLGAATRENGPPPKTERSPYSERSVD